MSTIWSYIRPFTHRSVLIIFLLGITSGLPFLLITSTLGAHLKDMGYSNTLICTLAWLTVPYALKFLWAPFIDTYSVPLLHNLLGRRRSWLLLAQCLTAACILLLNEATTMNLLGMVLTGLLLCICASTQDIVFEAFRVESLPENEQSYGAAAAVIGFRIGMLVSGAFALFLADSWGWDASYRIMAMSMGFGILGTFIAQEPRKRSPLNAARIPIGIQLKDFLSRRPWHVILPFIFFFKLGDTVMNTITVIFLTDIGFNKVEIAAVAKSFGITAMICGGFLGGIFLNYLNLRRTLILSCTLQIFSCLSYYFQAQVGHSLPLLYVTMAVENLSCGINQTALIAYLSRLCYQPSTATHFAILSSFSSFSRIQLSSLAGFVQSYVGWSLFHAIMAVFCLPALAMLWLFKMHFARFSFRNSSVKAPDRL